MANPPEVGVVERKDDLMDGQDDNDDSMGFLIEDSPS